MSSRWVRSSVTEYSDLTKDGGIFTKSAAVLMPRLCSDADKRLPMPHTSSMGVRRKIMSMASGRTSQ